MKKKALFYCRANQSLPQNKGVANKCLAQVESLRNLGWEVDYCWLNNQGVFMNDELFHKMHSLFLKLPAYQYLFFYCQFQNILRQKVDFSQYNLIYLRYEMSHPQLIQTLKLIKKNNPEIKTIIEIPTYPYESEQSGKLRRIQYLIDRFYRERLAGLVDLIVHYGIHDKVFGIGAIGISNGVKLNTSLPYKPSIENSKYNIRLIAVGTWNYWHGIDRLILGLNDYYLYNNKRAHHISLTIIGDGDSIPTYKNLVLESELQDKVIFLTAQPHNKLKQYLALADIGIGTLAIFRKGLSLDSSLKHREYCAAGLPFILSTKDLDFPSFLPWVLYVPENETPIPMESIIQFFEKISSKKSLQKEIINYAERHLSWESRWHQILKALEAAKLTIDS